MLLSVTLFEKMEDYMKSKGLEIISCDKKLLIFKRTDGCLREIKLDLIDNIDMNLEILKQRIDEELE